MATILIHDTVTAKTGSDHPYENQNGLVIASRVNAAGTIEHQVQFSRRVYTEEEQDRGEDTDPAENVIWFHADEIVKVGA